MNRINSLLVLLFVGSASIQAQSSDPFPDNDIPAHQYQGSMTINSQVVQNGAVVTDAFVAAYCEDVFRGKEKVGSGTNPNLAYLTVYGEYTGSDQYLYFKVYTNGKTFTYNPNPAIIFKTNDELGMTDPYIIDITPVSLANDADNSGVLTSYASQTIDVALTSRTLYKDGAWNTLCLPFPLTADEVTAYLAPDAMMTLSTSDFNSSNGTLTLDFVNATTITAGQPYIIKWTKPNDYEGNESKYDLSVPTFTGVNIPAAYTNAEAIGSALDAASVKTDYVDFVGTFSPVNIYTAEKTNLYLGTSNTLYYPTSTDFKVKTCRAYFKLKQGLTAGDPASGEAHVHAFFLDFGDDEETGIQTVNASMVTPGDSGWHTIDGRKLDGKPSQRGIYINNGRKVVLAP